MQLAVLTTEGWRIFSGDDLDELIAQTRGLEFREWQLDFNPAGPPTSPPRSTLP